MKVPKIDFLKEKMIVYRKHIAEAYLEPNRTSTMELYCENS